MVRVGLGPTPMLYFAVHTLGADGGLMVTGSHNPPTHNGFKMMRGKAAFFGRDIAELGSLAAKGDYGVGRGSVEEVAVLDDYVARLRADCAELDSLAIGWDSGNGATGQAGDPPHRRAWRAPCAPQRGNRWPVPRPPSRSDGAG